MTLALEEKYDQVRQLIAMGKERGYLLYDEVNDILPAEVHSSEEIDDLLSTFERYGIELASQCVQGPFYRESCASCRSTDQDLKTMLEIAQKNGLKTGIVTTAELTDATPAVLASHVSDRDCQGPGIFGDE